MTRDEMNKICNEFYDVGKEKYSAAFAAGYLQSQLLSILEELPVSKRLSTMASFQKSVEELKTGIF